MLLPVVYRILTRILGIIILHFLTPVVIGAVIDTYICRYFVMDIPLFCRSDCNTTKSSFVMIQ